MPRPTGPGGSPRLDARTPLRVELLEDRAVPSTGPIAAGDIHPVVVAGDPNGTEAREYADKDSPDNRIDPNSPESPYAGVGSIQVKSRLGTFIGTGSVVGSKYVVTAAHVVDLNNDGKVTSADKTQGVYFQLNLGGTPIKIAVTKFTVHPDYNGFGNPAVNDDVAILTLAKPVPAGVPVYSLPTVDLAAGTQLTMVGYGRSGDAVNGYTIPASPTIKRVGSNVADAFYGQDDPGRPEANEVFRFDFDGPIENGPLGGPTLGNTVETTLGGGDSGCPAFAGGILSGIGTFTQGDAPHFGSMGGGVNVFWYTGWINAVLLGAAAAYKVPAGRSTESCPPPASRPPSRAGPGPRRGRPTRRRPRRLRMSPSLPTKPQWSGSSAPRSRATTASRTDRSCRGTCLRSRRRTGSRPRIDRSGRSAGVNGGESPRDFFHAPGAKRRRPRFARRAPPHSLRA